MITAIAGVLKRIIALIIVWVVGGSAASLLLYGQARVIIDAYNNVPTAREVLLVEVFMIAVIVLAFVVVWACMELDKHR